MTDLEAIIAAVRAYAQTQDHPETSLTFRAITPVALPLDLLDTKTKLFNVDAINRRSGRANGFARWYSVVQLDSGTLLVEEHLSPERRARMPMHVAAR